MKQKIQAEQKCKYCIEKLGGMIAVDDVHSKDPKCIYCGRRILEQPNAAGEQWEKEFWLLWGLAPEGSLKYNKGNDIVRFIRHLLQANTKQVASRERAKHRGAGCPCTECKYARTQNMYNNQ